jgi:hypothetical protein
MNSRIGGTASRRKKEDVRASVKLLREYPVGLGSPIAPVLLNRSTITCTSCAFSTVADRFECCTRSTRAGLHCYSLGRQDGSDRWYEVFVPIADRLYDAHIEQFAEERRGGERLESFQC